MGARILVVEDNPHDRSLVAFLLGAFGHEATVVQDGASAVAAGREGRFDLALVDLVMPGMDGFETLAAMRADGAFAGVPVVALTILAGADDRRRALAAGFDGHIAKPIVPDGFGAELGAYLSPPATEARS